MSTHLLGTKIGMTQVFNSDGLAIPVTIIKTGPCTVVQLKNLETDGYNSIQIGYHEVPAKYISKPNLGHYKKFGVNTFKYLKEFRVDSLDDFNVGQEINVNALEVRFVYR